MGRWKSGAAAVLITVCALVASAVPAAAREAPAVKPAVTLEPQAVTFTSSIRISLYTSWRITSTTQLRVVAARVKSSYPTIRCAVRSLVKASGKPATAANVRCTGPVSAPGRYYRISLKRPTTTRYLKTVTMRFAQPAFSSTSSLLAAAPGPPLGGALESAGGVTFLRPTGWERIDFDDAVQLKGKSGTDECDVFVFTPVAADVSNGNASLYPQLFATVQALFGATPVTGDTGGDYWHRRQAGISGYGKPWVGLTLTAGGYDDVQAYLVRFGTQAVQIVMHSRAWAGCSQNGPFSAQMAMLFHTVNVAGSTGGASGYATRIVGEWQMVTGTIAGLYALGANGHYDTTVATSWPIDMGGVLYTKTSAWFGDGSYVLRGPILSQFPANGAAPSSSWIRIYNEADGAENKVWLCETSRYYDGTSGEACWRRST